MRMVLILLFLIITPPFIRRMIIAISAPGDFTTARLLGRATTFAGEAMPGGKLFLQKCHLPVSVQEPFILVEFWRIKRWFVGGISPAARRFPLPGNIPRSAQGDIIPAESTQTRRLSVGETTPTANLFPLPENLRMLAVENFTVAL